MSIEYDDRLVELILKLIVPPASTLVSVAKPWRLVLPALPTSQTLSGVPGCVFSQATGLVTGGSQAPARTGLAVARSRPITSAAIATSAAHLRSRPAIAWSALIDSDRRPAARRLPWAWGPQCLGQGGLTRPGCL